MPNCVKYAAFLVLVAAAHAARAEVVAVNEQIPWPQLVGTDGGGSAEDPMVFLYDNYTHSMSGLDIGTYYAYVQLTVRNQSNITIGGRTFLGGDYPNKPGESGDHRAYPGRQTLLVDNARLTTSHFRIGSKNSHNTLIVQNDATMVVNDAFYIDQYDEVGHNTAKVTDGGALSVLGGDMFVGYGQSYDERLVVTGGGTVNVGNQATSRRLRMRYTHDSSIRVAGTGSKLTVTGRLSLGEHGDFCYGNKLIIEDGGEVWLEDASSPFSSAYNSSQEMNKIQLHHGKLVVKGNQTSHAAINSAIWVWDGAQYVDGTLGDGPLTAGEYSATYFNLGDYAGYTVFESAAAPEPGAALSLSLGAIVLLRRRSRSSRR